MKAAKNVVSKVYTTACAKIIPVSLLPPRAASVVITASAIVGTAMNWNRRVNTVATKLKNSFSAGMPIQPKTAPRINAANHKTNWLLLDLALVSRMMESAVSFTSTFFFSSVM